MPPARSPDSQLWCYGSVAVEPDGITHIDFKLPPAPWRIRGAQPTITRLFRSGGGTGRVLSKSAKSRKSSSSGEDSDVEEDVVQQRNGTPVNDRPRTSPGPGSALAQTQTMKNDIFIDFREADSDKILRKGKGRQIPMRHPSIMSTSSIDDDAGRPNNSRTPLSSAHSTLHLPKSDDAPTEAEPDVWTRFGVQNGQPVFIKQQWRSSTKDKGCVTTWWECNSRVPLREPPVLPNSSDLTLGDLFCNRVVGIDAPRLWIWTTSGDKPPFWRPISEGDTREDGRRLSITPKLKRPSWVNSEWCVKQMVKHHRGQSVPRN